MFAVSIVHVNTFLGVVCLAVFVTVILTLLWKSN